ncbi:MAG: hypothetical protein ICV83_33930 [Cytophagales bacterium]|nr:hypothetical protein [Cytophagales bacterium]
MKAFAILTAGLLGLGALTANAQSAPARQASDPTYSRHNYKQPQKAAAARAEDTQTLSASTVAGVEQVSNPVATRRNYKLHDRNRKRTDAVLILPGKPVERTNTNPLDSKDNYKRQQQPARKATQPAPLPDEPVANTGRDEQK